ncbi:glycoside hydrolase family 92 protein [Schizophyllum commune]
MSFRLKAFLLLLPSIHAATLPPDFADPPSPQVDHVNPLIGNGGDTPNGSGGMIPSTAPPFAMTRWVAQTRENYVSMTPYNSTDDSVHGFQGTHQPAIWMGESGNVVVVPGSGEVKSRFKDRGMKLIERETREVLSPSYYAADLDLNGGVLKAEQSATSRVGHLRFTFDTETSQDPYVLIEASRPSIITSTPTNVTSPEGQATVDASRRQITGYNSERQDWIIDPISIHEAASGFKGYFCARFDRDFASYGLVQNGTTLPEDTVQVHGPLVSAYARFAPEEGDDGSLVVNVRVGVSFISTEQACKNVDNEIPDGTTLEDTARKTRSAWAEKLGRIDIEAAKSEDDLVVFYTAAFHALQYPYEQDEDGRYYSGYDNSVHEGVSYDGYSIWDVYRAHWAWLILMAPERVPGMITSMLNDYREGGWLPMWKNIVADEAQIATHADSMIAEAVAKGVKDFDLDLAWEAVLKDGTVPPVNDDNTEYDDRQENVDYEVRAGLSTVYADEGWVADDIHSESASRTLGYAYDDYAIYILAKALGKPENTTDFFYNRAISSSLVLFNDETNYMEAKNADGSWAGEENGWTEGDKWVYSFDVAHNIPGLIEKRGGKEAFVKSLDEFWDSGHADFGNEPAHHVPYLYALAGPEYAYKSQERVRLVARENYNNTDRGLSGNEDCGQMSAWYIFSALGFYPVDPVSAEYVVGSPFFDKVTIRLPSATEADSNRTLVVVAEGAADKPYVKSILVHGEAVSQRALDLTGGEFTIKHPWVAGGATIVFEMSEQPQGRGENATGRDESEL